MAPNETAAEDIRNALTLLSIGLDDDIRAEVRARLSSALGKIETPSRVNSGAARGIVVAHPGVPASLYMVSE